MADKEYISSFGISDVSLTDPYLTNALGLEVEYLTSFDPDKWLAGFRKTAGLDMKGKVRYGGWESSLIGGAGFGHYLGAAAQAYVSPDVDDTDKAKLYKDITYIIDELKVCQMNSKGKPGFIFCANIIDKDNVEKQFDNVEIGKTHIITEAWVPWYTVHKLLQGLVDVYNLMKYKPALEVAEGLGDWTYNRATGWSDELNRKVLATEYGGMNDCLYELYIASGNEKYAVAAHKFDEEPLFEKVLTKEANALTNRHANTTIPKFVGALKRYYYIDGRQIGNETVDASKYLRYAKAFFETVRDRHTYITGGNSEWEHFGEDSILDKERTNCNNETCNIYNMLKLARLLFMVTGDVQYADFYENAFINSILSSQNPKTGMTTYFQPMATGYFKVYGERYDKFWCCIGTGMENFTKLGDSIYFESEKGIYINMYLSSSVKSDRFGFTLCQKSDVIHGGNSTFTVKTGAADVDANLFFRIPDWAAGEISIKLNGEKTNYINKRNYACVNGNFKNGDEITVDIPMTVKAYPLPDDEASIGFKYGPVVLSAGLGTDDMQKSTTGMYVTIPLNKLVDSEYVVLPDGIGREKIVSAPMDFFEKEGAEKFRFKGTNLVYTPHYARFEDRYGIYFYFVTPSEYKIINERPDHSKDVIIDTVQPGYGQYENDELHDMKDTDSVGITNDGTYRYAKQGGCFGYFMAVNKDKKNLLSLTLRKSDNGKSLRISADENVLYDAQLDHKGANDTYELRLDIPDEVIAKADRKAANGKEYDVIFVNFMGSRREESARVCDFIYTLTEQIE